MNFREFLNKLPEDIVLKLLDLKQLRERPDFHPEESTFKHVQIVTERAITIGDPDLIAAGLFHDLHKLDTATQNTKTGWPTSPGHDKWAATTIERRKDIQEFILSINADPDTVKGICGQHMRIHQMADMKKSKQDALKEMKFFKKLNAFSLLDNMLLSDDEAVNQAKSILNGN